MFVLFYTLLEGGRIFPKRLWNKHRWTQASWVHDTAFGGRLRQSKSRKQGFLQSKSAFFSHIFGLRWLKSIVHVLFYTLLEDGRIFPKCLWIKHCETQASSVRNAAFGGRFDLIKPDHKFGQLDTCILYDERSLGKGNKLNIPWL